VSRRSALVPVEEAQALSDARQQGDRAQAFLSDRQRSLVEQLGVGEAALVVVEGGLL